MQISRLISLIPALLTAGTVWAAGLDTPRPTRVVSINLCTDQLALLVADQDQLISVSRLSQDPRGSVMVEAASRLTPNKGLAEEIYLLNPDLVLAGRFSSSATVAMLQRLDIPVVQFEPAYGLDHIPPLLRQMGEVLGQTERAAQIATEFEADLARFESAVSQRPRAALYYANSYTSGDKSLAGQILRAAGFSNVAAEAGYDIGGTLPLEDLLMLSPDALITGAPHQGRSRSEDVLDHPVVTHLRQHLPVAAVTDRDWICGTPFVLRAVAEMASLRRKTVKDQ